MQAVVLFSKTVTLPLATHFLTHLFNKKNKSQILLHLFYFSGFVVLSFMPFQLGILQSRSEGYDLESYGIQETGIVGIFQNPHTASITIATAIINLIFIYHFLLKKQQNILYKRICLLLIAIGIFFLYKIFVRTGYILLIIGLVVLFIRQLNYKSLKYFVLIIAISIAGLTYFYNSNEAFRKKISDDYTGQQKNDNLSRYGSGRFLFALTNIKNWEESSIIIQFVGNGEEISKDLMEKKIGKRLFSHNGFVDVLIQNGIIGLLIYIGFIISYYKTIRSMRNNPFYDLCNANFFMYLTMQLLQGGFFFIFDIVLAFNLSIAYNYNKLINCCSSLNHEIKTNNQTNTQLELHDSYR